MDWADCKKIRVAKPTKQDSNKTASIKEIAESKMKAANALAEEHYYAKLSLLYDVLRELLECLALMNGFKIYNHECYVPFLKEVLNESSLGDDFDKFRILRNGMNYYGKKITQEEGAEVARQMKEVIVNIEVLIETCYGESKK